jgi:acetoin:2,6-dichlorophenolindophenol oxidoreductase subunit beta
MPMYRQRLLDEGRRGSRRSTASKPKPQAAVDERPRKPRRAGPDPEVIHRRVGGWRFVVAELITYREAVARAIAQEMRRDASVVFLGEDVAAAGGVFKTTKGLLEEFGPTRVRDTPISEEAIIGAAMGAAMTGMRPIAEIMFSDFFATCWDLVAVEIAKTRYMTGGQVTVPLVIRTANGGGLRFGAQHSQAVENWAMMIPGLKVVAPSNATDLIGLFAAAVRDDDPVLFFEQKSLYPVKTEVPDGEIVDEFGTARIVRPGDDITIVALAAMVPRAARQRRSCRRTEASRPR